MLVKFKGEWIYRLKNEYYFIQILMAKLFITIMNYRDSLKKTLDYNIVGLSTWIIKVIHLRVWTPWTWHMSSYAITEVPFSVSFLDWEMKM